MMFVSGPAMGLPGDPLSGLSRYPGKCHTADVFRAFLLSAAFLMAFLPRFEPSRADVKPGSAYPVLGLDISHHQGEVDWKQIKSQGIRFVYMKATEGGNFKDPAFSRNWKQAKKENIHIGAYHFFTLCKKGAEQAENYIDSVPLDPLALPPAIDFEFQGNCGARPEKELVLKELFGCIRRVKEKYGKQPVLYLTQETYEAYLKGRLKNRRVWLREYQSDPAAWFKGKWLLWQYTNRGRIKGIKGPVDMNRFNGTASDFTRFIGETIEIRKQENDQAR